jgi:hypothetical protein
MEFQSISSVDQANQLYLLRLKDIKFLIGAPLNFSQILNYLPNDGNILSDEDTNVDSIKKKMKTDGTPMRPTDEKIVNQAISNDRYLTVNGKKYLKGPLRYDLSLFTSVDISSIDYILISNLNNIYALPYLTEGFTNFSGRVIMTRPVQQIGYELLKEFLQMNNRRMDRENQIAAGMSIAKNFIAVGQEKSDEQKNLTNNYYEYFLSDNKDKEDHLWSEADFLDMFEKMGLYVNEWCKMFSDEDLENCFEKVDVINYKEEIKLRHNIALNVHSSGLHIGSCYWNFDTGLERISLIDGVASHHYRHSLSLDLEPLMDSSTIIMTNC